MCGLSAGVTDSAERSGPRVVAELDSVGTPGLVFVRLAVDLAGIEVHGRAASLGSCVVGVAFDVDAFAYLGAYGGGPGFLAPPEVSMPVQAGGRAALVVRATVETQASPPTGVVQVARLCFLREGGRGWLHCELWGACASLRGPGGEVLMDLAVQRTTRTERADV